MFGFEELIKLLYIENLKARACSWVVSGKNWIVEGFYLFKEVIEQLWNHFFG